MPKAADAFGIVRDRAVYRPGADALIAADLHLGKVAASPVELPVQGDETIADRLLKLVDRFEPADVVLAGDVLHAFGFVPRTARAAVADLTDRVTAAGATLVMVEGNHDVQLAEITDLTPIDAYELMDGTVVCHGHERPDTDGSRYVIGHDHPALDIEGRRRPCHLHGPEAYEGADVFVLPAFNPAIRGTPVNTLRDNDPLSPLLTDISAFQPVIWDAQTEETLVFPRLRALRSHL